jgi:defect-in-organelle-trafficking protein DotD
MKNSAIIMGTLIALVGCTPLQSKTPGQDPTRFNVDDRLAEAAHSIESSLRTLAAAQYPQAMDNAINTSALETTEGGLGGKTNIDWAGPIEPLLDKVAKLSTYRIKVLGAPPSIPVIVSMTAQQRSLADILKDAGLQAGKRASLVVYPGSRIIELRYLPV